MKHKLLACARLPTVKNKPAGKERVIMAENDQYLSAVTLSLNPNKSFLCVFFPLHPSMRDVFPLRNVYDWP